MKDFFLLFFFFWLLFDKHFSNARKYTAKWNKSCPAKFLDSNSDDEMITANVY